MPTAKIWITICYIWKTVGYMSKSILLNCRTYTGLQLVLKSVTLNDLKRSSAALSPLCHIKRQVSELTTPNKLKIGD